MRVRKCASEQVSVGAGGSESLRTGVRPVRKISIHTSKRQKNVLRSEYQREAMRATGVWGAVGKCVS